MLNSKIISIIKSALEEDIGNRDITTYYTIPSHSKAEAAIISKEKSILCGIEVAEEVFRNLDKKVKWTIFKKDGDIIKNGDEIARIKGMVSSILTGERTALNFLSRLSGIAALTRKFVEKTRNTKAKILDTRKTTPNLRILEKYAVRIGGGFNHRKNLESAILIKDNHLSAGKFVNNGRVDENMLVKIISYLKKIVQSPIEIEVENLDEFKSIIKCNPDIVLLDNFSLQNLKKAVEFRNDYYSKIELEASGGVNLDNVKKIAQTGVDFISVGRLTHSPQAIDFSLQIIV